MVPSSPIVLHSLPVWLPRTSTWLHSLVTGLPHEIRNVIVCRRTEHLDQFPVANLHNLAQCNTLTRQLDRIGRKLLLPGLTWLGSMARQLRPDIIHSHWGDIAWEDAPAVRPSGALHIVTFYGKDVNYLPVTFPRWRRRYRSLLAHIDLVVCEGPFMAARIIDLGCPPDRVVINAIGVDLDRIPFKPRTWQPGTRLRFLIAASFREKKGIPDAIEAIARATTGLDFQITIIGDASADQRSIPEKERILAALDRNRLRERTRLLGYQPYEIMLREADEHHLFVSPSVTAADGDTEGGAPVTIIEMAASGMPIISTTHCDIPYVVEHGKGGLLAPEHDVAALAANIRSYIEAPERWPAMLAAGRQRMEAEFNLATQCARMAKHYHETLRRVRSQAPR